MNNQEERQLREIIHSEVMKVNSKNNLRKIVQEELNSMLKSDTFKNAIIEAFYAWEQRKKIRDLPKSEKVPVHRGIICRSPYDDSSGEIKTANLYGELSSENIIKRAELHHDKMNSV